MLALQRAMDDQYEAQDRGTDAAYERYLQGMDQSMRQKVALTAAHLLGEGTVADMGMGSGSGTLALASLYPRVRVIGVDINPTMVTRATERHRLPNLTFTAGDIAKPVFDRGFLDGVFDSSVLHHVTSFSGYDHEAAARALAVQSEQLKTGGSLIVRDFVAPESQPVFLDLPDDDANAAEPNAAGATGLDATSNPIAQDAATSAPSVRELADPRRCSTAALFLRFSREFRKLSETPGFDFREITGQVRLGSHPPLRAGWRRFELDARMAAEFLLRKDYRADWESEVLEEYTYFTQARFEQEFASLGLRILASLPIHNPWIVSHRLRGRCALWSHSGEPLAFPATNHLIVGEKVAQDQGVRFAPGQQVPPVGFLHWHFFQHRDGGSRELVRRPGTTLDVVPWFRDAGGLYVLARKSHPRPVLQCDDTGRALDGAAAVGYVTEPIVVLQSDAPLGLTVERALGDAASLAPSQVIRLEEVATYYPSPGGLVEEVRAVHVEIEPSYIQAEVENTTGFSTGGSVRAVDARQVLRAAQVGALPDVRLELNVYELLRRTGEAAGPWIGSTLELPEAAPPSSQAVSFRAARVAPRRLFSPIAAHTPQFLQLKSRTFTEYASDGSELHSQPREYVVPRTLSSHTVACALLRRHGDQIWIGLDDDDLAAAQCFTGSSALWVTPAWRLPNSFDTLDDSAQWVRERLSQTYGLTVGTFTTLGGKYFPSAGVTPEAVHIFAAAVVSETLGESPQRLHWFLLRDLVSAIEHVRDGHLRIAANRAAHALGLII